MHAFFFFAEFEEKVLFGWKKLKEFFELVKIPLPGNNVVYFFCGKLLCDNESHVCVCVCFRDELNFYFFFILPPKKKKKALEAQPSMEPRDVKQLVQRARLSVNRFFFFFFKK